MPILILLYISFKSECLIPKGYELGIDGFVIARALVLISLLHMLSKLGIIFYKISKKMIKYFIGYRTIKYDVNCS